MGYVDSRREELRHIGFALSRTYGKSMRPLIWGGRHYVAVVPLEGEPRPGDLLQFMQRLPDGREISVVHRLVEVKQEGDQHHYITRGDNCLASETVLSSEIIGKVAEVHRVAGFRPWYAIPARKFAVTDSACRRYTRFWMAIWPARRFYYRVRAHAASLMVRIGRIIK